MIGATSIYRTSFPGDYSGLAPPDSISNSEVKRTCANDSVGFPHVKVGHRQVLFFPLRRSRRPSSQRYRASSEP